MGHYIQGPTKGKVDFLVHEFSAIRTTQPISFSMIPGDKELICVVDNGIFDAAAWCFSEREFDEFTQKSDPRPKRWLLMDSKLVREKLFRDAKNV